MNILRSVKQFAISILYTVGKCASLGLLKPTSPIRNIAIAYRVGQTDN